MLRSNGMPLYSTTDVALPMGRVSFTLAANPKARPLTPQAFIDAIRLTAKRAATPVHEN